jgi:DNA polymerase-3 subunit epsilon
MISFFRKSGKKELPAFIRHYNSLDFTDCISKEMEDTVFVVLDCETTGVKKSDQIITIGAVKVSGNSVNIADALDLKFSSAKGSQESTVHGELKISGGTLEDNRKAILDFIQNHPIVGHHIQFDISKLNQLFRTEYPSFKIRNKVIDTISLTFRLFKEELDRSTAENKSLQLEKLCSKFNIPIENRHTALGDALMTALLFLKYKSLLKKRGINNTKKLVK